MGPNKPRFADINQVIHELFDKLVYRQWSLKEPGAWEPLLDLFETEDAYLVEIDLPDVPPTDVRLVLTEHSLRISGERRRPGSKGTLHGLPERRHGAFERLIVFRLPVDPRKAMASYQHGAYRVYIPKKRSFALTSLLDTKLEWEVHIKPAPEGGEGYE